MGKIVVVGSLIADITGYTPRFPVTGESVLGRVVKFGPGGKGNNQATAAARVGGSVTMISRMGRDFLRDIMLSHYERERMSTRYIGVSDTLETGSAIIEVHEQTGENRIIVVKGANDEITAADVEAAEPEFADCDVFLTQLETSIESVLAGKRLAAKHAKPMILNPAPFQPIPDGLFEGVDFLTPNETEAEYFSGVAIRVESDARQAAIRLMDRGVKNVIITMGRQGAYLANAERQQLIPTTDLKPVDTTGAGDAFNGALAVAVSERMPIDMAIQFANCVASISVTRRGSAPSMPSRAEALALLKSHYGIIWPE